MFYSCLLWKLLFLWFEKCSLRLLIRLNRKIVSLQLGLTQQQQQQQKNEFSN